MKKVLLFMMSLPVVLGMMASCSDSKADVQKLNGKWTIVEVNGMKVETEKMPYIEFNMAENKVHGNAGCNMFNTVIKPDAQNSSAFTMNQAAATMMACPNMDVESKIFRTFESVKGVKGDKDPNKMLLTDASGNTLLVLKKS